MQAELGWRRVRGDQGACVFGAVGVDQLSGGHGEPTNTVRQSARWSSTNAQRTLKVLRVSDHLF